MCVSFFKRKIVPHGKKTRPFLNLYTKTHPWACIRLEKRGHLAHTRNGLILLQIIFVLFSYMKTLVFSCLKIKTIRL